MEPKDAILLFLLGLVAVVAYRWIYSTFVSSRPALEAQVDDQDEPDDSDSDRPILEADWEPRRRPFGPHRDRNREDEEEDDDQIEVEHVETTGHWRDPQALGLFVVPFPRNPDFVGREYVLDTLKAIIPPHANKDGCQMTVLEGPPGIGKTQIVVEAAYRIHDEDPDCSVFWVAASDANTVEKSYRDIARALKILDTDSADSAADVKSLVKLTLSRSVNNWVLVCEDVDPVAGTDRFTPLSAHIPHSKTGSLIFTTRDYARAGAIPFGDKTVITVPQMGIQEAEQLFRIGLDESRIVHFSAGLCTMLLGFYPLALKLASAYIAAGARRTTGDFVFSNNDPGTGSTARRRDDIAKGFRALGFPPGLEKPIVSAWVMSYDSMLRDAPGAAELLKKMCCLAEQDISIHLIPGAAEGAAAVDEAVRALKAYGMITEQKVAGRFCIHRLVRLMTRNAMERSGEQARFFSGLAIKTLLRVVPHPDDSNKNLWVNFLPHVAAAALEAPGLCPPTDDRFLLMSLLGIAYNLLEMDDEAEPVFRRAQILAERVLHWSHPDTFIAVANLAVAIGNQGRTDEAKQMLRTILELMERVLGTDHGYTTATRSNLETLLAEDAEDTEDTRNNSSIIRRAQRRRF